MKSKNIIMLVTMSILVIAGIILFKPTPTLTMDNLDSTSEHLNRAEQKKESDIDHVFQESVKTALSDYEDKMRFPTYSVPITQNDWSILNPRAFEVVPQPIFNEEGFISNLGDIKISLEVENFIVDINHDLPVKVKIVSEKKDTKIDLATVSIMVKSSDDPYSDTDSLTNEKINLQKTWQNTNDRSLDEGSQEEGSQFSGVVPSSLLKRFGESNVHLVAELVFSEGTEAMTGAAIKLFESTASLKKIGRAYVDGPHLIIPVDLFAEIPGYFRVQANLFDKTGKLPIAHLTEEIKTEGGGLISGFFKVHIVTLKEQNNSGPYILKNIHISKLPTQPDYKPRYGNYDPASYAIAGFNFKLYKHEDYVNPEMLKRLAALKKITDEN